MNHLRWYSIAMGAAAAATAGAVWLMRLRRKKPDREKLRREWLSRTGRLTIGTAMDLQDGHDEKNQPVRLLIYRYDVAGVAYEASQDITQLAEIFHENPPQLGLPASVRYDPHNPGNSIVVSETWSGLRT